MLTVENSGLPIWEHRLSTGEVVTIPDNSCRDIAQNVYLELVKEYNWLKVVALNGEEVSSEEVQSVEKVEDEQKEKVEEIPDDKNLDFIKGLKEASQYICSVCDRKFDTSPGMRIHMKKSHE